MEANQIIRIPVKYWELFNTMSDEESWKLIKSLFIWKDDWLNWLTLTYYNIIMVDINNLFNSASNWKKGGRPKSKPEVIEIKNPRLWKTVTNTSKDKIREVKISKDKEIKHKHGEYKNILLSEKEFDKLLKDYWKSTLDKYMQILDEWIEMKWYKYKNHNLALRSWIKRDKDSWVVVAEVSNDYEKQKAERLARYWIKDDWF